MSAEHKTEHKKGYETSDAHAGDTYRAGLYILGTMFLVAAVVVPLYRMFARHETASQRPPANVIREPATQPAATFPKLVSSEPLVLAEFRRQEDEILNGYGWVEKDRALARMPIAEAMRIVGARGGLPTFPAPVASAVSGGSALAGSSPPPAPAGAEPRTGGGQ